MRHLLLLCLTLGLTSPFALESAQATRPATQRLSAAAAEFGARLSADGDALGRPFAVVDKNAAQLVVFRADGSLAGSSDVLVGRDKGDDTVPGVGERTQSRTLRPGDATTPAGRFESWPGRNLSGEAVVWVDYAAAFAIHRLRPGAGQVERLRRLASPSPLDNRSSAGCVVVPVAFYDSVVQPLLGTQRGVVYVLPESSP